ncbi:hypothetical protein GCM10022226_78360 [Sphaerisporangium flaviroseum]|uniref:Uncharacterized protein n=1 Tax=Sphaerisporangium flaviroseum TaxID=509199 RepID=A0ABP7JGP9_9ACTN
MDLRMLAAGSFGERTGAMGAGGVPASAVGDHGLLHRGGQAVPQMPAVADLYRVRCALADGFGVGGRAVAAHDLDAGVRTQPRDQRGGLAVGQHIDAAVGDRVDEQGRIAVATPQREVIASPDGTILWTSGALPGMEYRWDDRSYLGIRQRNDGSWFEALLHRILPGASLPHVSKK